MVNDINNEGEECASARKEGRVEWVGEGRQELLENKPRWEVKGKKGEALEVNE